MSVVYIINHYSEIHTTQGVYCGAGNGISKSILTANLPQLEGKSHASFFRATVAAKLTPFMAIKAMAIHSGPKVPKLDNLDRCRLF